MTLDDYLRRESPYLAHRRLWSGRVAYCLLALLVSLPALVAVALPVLGAFVPLLLLLGVMVGLTFFERALNRRLSRRYGLICPGCGEPYHLPLRRRVGQLIPVPVCGRCRRPVVEAAGSESDAKVRFLKMTADEYSRQQFAAAVARHGSHPDEPPPREPPGVPMTLDDYLRREVAFDQQLGHWQMAGAGVFFGALIAGCAIGMALDLSGAVPSAVCGAVMMVYLVGLSLGSLLGLAPLERAATRKLAPRYGLTCPHCHGPCVAPRHRRPGQLIDMMACRRCGGAVVEPPARADAAESATVPGENGL
jgi:hypothetical protein